MSGLAIWAGLQAGVAIVPRHQPEPHCSSSCFLAVTCLALLSGQDYKLLWLLNDSISTAKSARITLQQLIFPAVSCLELLSEQDYKLMWPLYRDTNKNNIAAANVLAEGYLGTPTDCQYANPNVTSQSLAPTSAMSPSSSIPLLPSLTYVHLAWLECSALAGIKGVFPCRVLRCHD